MFRALLLALIVGLSFEVSGLATVCGGPLDRDECADGECAPSCHCACCSLPKTIVPTQAVALPSPPTATHAWRIGAGVPSSINPAEIFHVPKRLLA